MHKFLFCLTLLSIGTASSLQSQDDSTKVSFFPLPLIYYTPETNWAFGAAGVFTFPTGTDLVSQVQLGGAYTLRKQLLLYLPFQLFLREDQLRFDGELGYYKYRYFYYGIGNSYEDYDGETYDVTYPRFRLNTLWRIRNNTYAGLGLAYDDFNITQIDSTGLLATVPTTGSAGSIYAAAGPVFRLDTRDHLYFPTEGWLANASFLHNGGWLGSALKFSQWQIDVRHYISKKEERVLALQAVVAGRAGNTPFNQLAFIGGGNLLRGYIDGRYRDEQAAVIQAEYRFPLFGRFGAVAFAGVGTVTDSWSNWQVDYLRPAAGVGVRFTILPDDKIRARLDYGIGQNSSGIYLTVGEAF